METAAGLPVYGNFLYNPVRESLPADFSGFPENPVICRTSADVLIPMEGMSKYHTNQRPSSPGPPNSVPESENIPDVSGF